MVLLTGEGLGGLEGVAGLSGELVRVQRHGRLPPMYDLKVDNARVNFVFRRFGLGECDHRVDLWTAWLIPTPQRAPGLRGTPTRWSASRGGAGGRGTTGRP